MKNQAFQYWFFLALIAAIIIFTGCQTKSEPAVAQVGTTKLTKAELMAQLPEGVTVSPENLPMVLDQWINSELLYQEAVRQGLTKDEKLKFQAQQMAKEFIIKEFLTEQAKKIKIPSDQLLAYFNKYKEDFMSEVKIRRIVLSSEELAEQTLTELKGGANFAKLAKERYIEQTADKGEPSRFFARGITDPGLEEVIFALKPGQISNVLKTAEGCYQIIQIVEKIKVKKDITFTDVAEYIENALSLMKSRANIDSIITSLRAKGKFQTFPKAYFTATK